MEQVNCKKKFPSLSAAMAEWRRYATSAALHADALNAAVAEIRQAQAQMAADDAKAQQLEADIGAHEAALVRLREISDAARVFQRQQQQPNTEAHHSNNKTTIKKTPPPPPTSTGGSSSDPRFQGPNRKGGGGDSLMDMARAARAFDNDDADDGATTTSGALNAGGGSGDDVAAAEHELALLRERLDRLAGGGGSVRGRLRKLERAQARCCGNIVGGGSGGAACSPADAVAAIGTFQFSSKVRSLWGKGDGKKDSEQQEEDLFLFGSGERCVVTSDNLPAILARATKRMSARVRDVLEQAADATSAAASSSDGGAGGEEDFQRLEREVLRAHASALLANSLTAPFLAATATSSKFGGKTSSSAQPSRARGRQQDSVALAIELEGLIAAHQQQQLQREQDDYYSGNGEGGATQQGGGGASWMDGVLRAHYEQLAAHSIPPALEVSPPKHTAVSPFYFYCLPPPPPPGPEEQEGDVFSGDDCGEGDGLSLRKIEAVLAVVKGPLLPAAKHVLTPRFSFSDAAELRRLNALRVHMQRAVVHSELLLPTVRAAASSLATAAPHHGSGNPVAVARLVGSLLGNSAIRLSGCARGKGEEQEEGTTAAAFASRGDGATTITSTDRMRMRGASTRGAPSSVVTAAMGRAWPVLRRMEDEKGRRRRCDDDVMFDEDDVDGGML